MGETSSPSSSPSKKKLKMMIPTTDPDLISPLPDQILHHILSFLDTKQVVRTCILSKRWKYLWVSIQTLDFNDLKWYLTQKGGYRKKFKKAKFRYFVDSVLLLRDGSDIHKFSLYLSSVHFRDCNRIDRWIKYALARNVQVLTFGATEFFHNNPIRLGGYVKTLELKSVFLHDWDVDEELVMDLPVVENLILESNVYCNIRRLVIIGHKLQYLRVESYDPKFNHSTMIRVYGPKLVWLKCEGYMFKDYTLENLSSLFIAEIDTMVNRIDNGIPGVPKMDEEGFGKCMYNILSGVSNAISLRLSAHGMQDFSELPSMSELGPISCRNLRHLRLIKWHNDKYIHSVAKLLELLPNVKTLYLEASEIPSDFEMVGGDWGEQLPSQSLFCHLKSIEISNLAGCDNELKFIAFLLKSAPVLEKITLAIVFGFMQQEHLVLEFCEKLLSLPQASSCVTLSFTFIGVFD